MRRLAVLILATLSVASCATGVSYEGLQPTLGPIPEDHARVFVYRLDGDGERLTTAIRASGLPVGRSVSGEFFYTDLTIGTHLLTATRSTDRTLSVRLFEGDVKYVRVDVKLRAMRWDWEMTLVPEEVALAQIRRTTYSGE